MRGKADIVVFDESGQSIALIQVKGIGVSTPEWAADVRRQTFPRNPPAVPFFLVVARDFTYLWTQAEANLPTFVIPTKELLRGYIEDLNASFEDIGRSPLELITGSWLIDVTNGLPGAIEHSAVRDSGLAAALFNGRIDFADAA